MYRHSAIEKKIRAFWEKHKTYEPDIKKAKHPFYNLMMFPYPSAEGLHVGNMYAFVGSDIYGRFKRMMGFNVFEPIGLDGFGIHSENYALKIGAHPMRLAKKTEKRFYEQLHSIGNGFAWNERLETYDPDYYKWTQWIFVQMFKRGLAYRKKALVNWCPFDKTVLADEQVIGGCCERCGNVVIKKELEQWFFKITNYAERLLKNLEHLDWSEKVKIAQKNWIGKSEGAEIDFKVLGAKERITVFTTRPDTLFGATYMVLAPEHPLIEVLWDKISNTIDVEEYIAEAKKKSEADRMKEDKEKTGVELKGVKAINPANQEEIPIFVADYVVWGYGTGAIMAVPVHDQRDFEFAKKFNLRRICVIKPQKTFLAISYNKTLEERQQILNRAEENTEIQISKILSGDACYIGEGTLINSRNFNGMKSEEVKRVITDFVGGKLKTTYRLRDWLISRQRYWGPPIPMIHCDNCGWVSVPEKDLPVKLPLIKDFRPKGSGESPLASVKSFYQVKCPVCKKMAHRETDISDTFLDSAWYFYRYLDIKNKKEVFNKDLSKHWLPVHMYTGGAEHSVLHLLYTRFLAMVFNEMGLISFEEPFAKFRAHGLLIKDGAKMSKSKGNVVNPDEYIKKYGIDVFRMYLMFLGPFSEGGDFRDSSIAGITRFLSRVWELMNQPSASHTPNSDVQRLLHKTIKKVTEDIEELHYNTAISALMILLNEFEANREHITSKDKEIFVKLLSPFAPFITEELHLKFSGKNISSIHTSEWPKYDERLLEEDVYMLIVQINGKMRDQFEVSKSLSQKEIEALTLKREKVTYWISGKTAKKIVFVLGKLINFVL